MGADVIPIRRVLADRAESATQRRTPRRPRAAMPCAVCRLPAYPIADDYRCDRCEATALHQECYWGRVASLSEWQAHYRLVDGAAENPAWEDVICPGCRAKAGS